MTIANDRIFGAPAPAVPAAGPTPPQPEDTAGFRRLLESLERHAAEHREAPPLADPESVGDAVAKADAGYSIAMDLRQRLEAAFRQRLP